MAPVVPWPRDGEMEHEEDGPDTGFTEYIPSASTNHYGQILFPNMFS
eukprot:COSAG05_NODE_195_length_14550_cov_203.233686_8_plen_47_part_00